MNDENDSAAAEQPLTCMAPTSDPPLDPAATVLWFTDLAQRNATDIFLADGTITPRAWLLGRRSPISGAVYPDGKLGIYAAAAPKVRNELDLQSLLTWIEELSVRSAAVGVAFVMRARAVVVGDLSDHGDRLSAARTAPEVLYLTLEHRALSCCRHRVAVIAPSNVPQLGPWKELRVPNPASAGSNPGLLPSFLPPLN